LKLNFPLGLTCIAQGTAWIQSGHRILELEEPYRPQDHRGGGRPKGKGEEPGAVRDSNLNDF